MADSNAITFYRGDSYPISLTIKDAATKAAVNLSGASLKLTVNSEPSPLNDDEQVFQLEGVVQEPATGGIVRFTPTAEDTSLPVKKYFYDIELTDSDGNIRTVVKSTFSILQDITK